MVGAGAAGAAGAGAGAATAGATGATGAATTGAGAAEAAGTAPQSSLLAATTGSGTIAVGSIVYDKTNLTNVHSNVTLNHGVIQLSPLTGNVYGGQANGGITIDTRPSVPTYAVNTKLIAQCTQGGKSIAQAIDWGATELEGYMRS